MKSRLQDRILHAFLCLALLLMHPALSQGNPTTGGQSTAEGLLFYADFEGSPNARLSAGRGKVLNPSPDFSYTRGISGKAIQITDSAYSSSPEYASDMNVAKSEGTLAFWFRPEWDAGTKAPGKPARYLLASQGNDWKFYLYTDRTNIAFGYYNKAEAPDWKKYDWHHLVLQWNKSETAIYLDGKLAQRNAVRPDWKKLWQFGEKFALGGLNDKFYADGSYDELAIWNRNLSVDEIRAVYMKGRDGKPLVNDPESHPLAAGKRPSRADPAVATDRNLLMNGSFEAGHNNWLTINVPALSSPAVPSFRDPHNNDSQAVLNTQEASHGKQSLAITLDPNPEPGSRYRPPRQGTALLRSTAFWLDPARPYRVSADIMVKTLSAVDVELKLTAVRALDKIPENLEIRKRLRGGPTGWQTLTFNGLPFSAHDDLYRVELFLSSAANGKSTVLIDALEVIPATEQQTGDWVPANEIAATLQSRTVADIHQPEGVVLHATHTNQSSKSAGTDLAVRIFDFWDRQVYDESYPVKLPAFEKSTRKITPTINKSGLYRAELVEANGSVIDEITFSVLPPATRSDRLGVHVTYDRNDLEAAKRLGISWVRLWDNGRPTEWVHVQPERDGVFRWDYSDRIINRTHEQGFRLLGMLTWPQNTRFKNNWVDNSRPHWLHTRWGPKDNPNQSTVQLIPTDLLYDEGFRKKWLDYVSGAVSRYRGKIDHWELLNEPYIGGTPEWVADLYRFTVPVIRQANPDAVIVGPSIYHKPEWVRPLLTENILEHIDVFSYHGYRLDSQPVRTIHAWSRSDGKPRTVFDTEDNGISSSRFFCRSCLGSEFSGFIPPTESAARMARYLAINFGEGTDTFFYYWMVHYDPYQKHGSFFNFSGGLRAPAVVYATIGSLIADLPPAEKKRSKELSWYLFNGNPGERAVAILWREDRPLGAGKIRMPADITLMDVMGAAIERVDSHPALGIAGMPVFAKAGNLATMKKFLAEIDKR